MNEIIMSAASMPVFCGCDFLTASEDFIHIDRTADFHVLIYVTEGTIYVTEEDTDYTIHPGEMLFLKHHRRHFGKTKIPKGTSWYFVHFYLDEAADWQPVFTPDRGPLIQYTPAYASTTLPKHLTGLSGSTLEEHIASLIKLYHSDDPMKKWYVNTKLFYLLSEIAFYRQSVSKTKKLSEEICHYLTKHYQEPFSAKRLEETFYLSYKYMAASFKSEMQVSMQQYHMQIRMNHACKLLRSTLLPVSEIAEAVGYSDQLYFSRCFHRLMGVSPSEYRKLLFY